MESYVERFTREKREAAQKAQKEQEAQKGQNKEVIQDGEDTRGEGHEAQNKKRRKQ